MKTLLVISPKSDFAAEVRAALPPNLFRVIPQSELNEDELRLGAASIDACICDTDSSAVQSLAAIERARHVLPDRPLIVYTAASNVEWEEDAYELGAAHILSKPVRGRLLAAVLKTLLVAGSTIESSSPKTRPRPWNGAPAVSDEIPPVTLELLRNYSSILLHNLNVQSLVKEFLPSLRKIIGVNRAAIFLRQPPTSLGDAPEQVGARRLRAACSVGLLPGLLEHFELSLESGVGGHLFRHGRILRRDSEEVQADQQMGKEFELLSAQVAIPVLDRESLIGVAVFDGKVTGEPVSNQELLLVFHLLEQLGQSIKNIWLNDQLGADRGMIFDILQQFNNGCVVIGRDLSILYANEMARSCFSRNREAAGAFEFSDLPQAIGSRVFEVLKTGAAIPRYRYQPDNTPERNYQITATPFKKRNAAVPNAALLIIEDCSQSDRLRQLEVETANLRLVQEMAERLAHEIGNAVLPLSTHQQLLQERGGDLEFQESLAGALEEGVRRVSRLVNQMRYLARDRMEFVEAVSVKKLIEEAFREARGYHPGNSVRLTYEASEPLTLACDRVGLQHAFAEIILNALQASGKPSQVRVRSQVETGTDGARWARIEIEDSGGGFTPEAASKASKPFFTTRNVGLGLGLAVTNKIIQTHSGKLEIPPPQPGHPGLVRVSLPLKTLPAPSDN